MLNKFLTKIVNLPTTLCIKLSPVFNRWYFHAKGVTYGGNMVVRGKVSIVGQGRIVIGKNFCMTSGEYINPISSNLRGSIYTDCSQAEISIGDNVGMSSTRMWIHDSLTIGNNVKIGAGALFIDTDCHPMDFNIRRNSNEGTKSAHIVVEDDAWIGAQCVVLKGVTIGARSIIGAGSVVTKSIPADCIAAGNPCRVIRKINE